MVRGLSRVCRSSALPKPRPLQSHRIGQSGRGLLILRLSSISGESRSGSPAWRALWVFVLAIDHP